MHSVFFGRFLSGLGFKKIELFKKPIDILNYKAHGGPVQIVNFLCPIDEISVIRASIEHKKLTI
jgi:hypothetical protein